MSFTDAAGNTTSFTYHANHYLHEIQDPLGRALVKNFYDAEGRLIRQEDGLGQAIAMEHDLTHRREAVRDRNGNVSVFVYDEQGNVLTETDPLGNTTTRTYDGRGNTLTETDALGNTTHHSYDSRDRELSTTDALGHTTAYTYDDRNQVTTLTDAAGHTTRMVYESTGSLRRIIDPLGQVMLENLLGPNGWPLTTTDALGNVTALVHSAERSHYGLKTKQTDADGAITEWSYTPTAQVKTESRWRTNAQGQLVKETTTYDYDANDRVIKTTDALGGVTTTEYTKIGKVAATTDALGQRTSHEYDIQANLIKTTYPDGSFETWGYDANNNQTRHTNRAGQVTQSVYDANNRLIKTIQPTGAVSETVYDAAGRVSESRDANGQATHYQYDAAGRRTALLDGHGATTSFSYDASGNQLSVTDALGHTTRTEYDGLNRRIKTLLADGSSTHTTYDAKGQRLTETDAAGVVTRFGYDSQGRLSTVTDALGGLTLYSYDETGNKLSQTDALGRTTSWSYDALGRVLSRTLPLGQSESFSYDAAGNRLSQTDFNGQTIQFAYDPNNQLIRKTLPSGQVSYTYSASGQPETITDARGTTRYAYDQRGQLLQLTQPNGLTLAYAYDAVGNRTAVTTPSGTTQFVYDDLNRLDQVIDAQGGETFYSYNAVGLRTSVLYPNATRTNTAYDALNRLTQLENLDATGQIISSHAYILGPTGQRLKITEANGRVVDYQYDPLYRLTQEKITDPAGSETLDFAYDAVGNRLSESRNGVVTPSSYDDNDRLLTQGDITYSYDDNGNTLSKIGLEGTVQYGYDVENRLISVTSGASTLHYAYDDSGIRVQARVDGAITDYLVDHNRDYAQVLEERDGAGAVAVDYLYGDDLISQDQAGQRSYYHYDGLGSTQALSDQAGLLANTYQYRPFGELAHSSGNIANNYLFAGEQFEPKTGLYYLRNRWMGPPTGRFLSRDSFNGFKYSPLSQHKYLYAHANPVNNIDPSGRSILGLAGVAFNVTVAAIAVYSTAQILGEFASGERELSAKDIGLAILWTYAGSKAGPIFGKITDTLRRAGCLGNSFVGSTLVETSNGFKRIDEIGVGDFVLSRNFDTNTNEYQPVISVITNTKQTELVILTLDSGEKIEATLEHLIFTGQDWVQAQQFVSGMNVFTADGQLVQISHIAHVAKNIPVYDLTIEKNQNFFVSKNRVLVHNISPCEKFAQTLAETAKKVPREFCEINFCKQFVEAFEKLLVEANIKGKRLCLRSKHGGIWSDKDNANIAEGDGNHVAIQVGDLVFDNLNPDGTPLSKWLHNLGGDRYIGLEPGLPMWLTTEEFGSDSDCLNNIK